eukprot:7168317-Lingulodinium_polyedra.AAC.1
MTSAGSPRPRFRARILSWPREKRSSSSSQAAPRAGAAPWCRMRQSAVGVSRCSESSGTCVQ